MISPVIQKGSNKMTQQPYEFIFHNVGHGLFYSGKIENFNFIYDCGAKSNKYLKEQIIDYKKLNEIKKINLLIISHFHADHISGLDILLKNVDLETVIIPYYKPIDRLILSYSVPVNSPLLNFYINPVKYFLDKGAENIIIVGTGSEGQNWFEKYSLDKKDEKMIKFRLHNLKDKKIISIINEYDKDIVKLSKRHNIMFLDHNTYFNFRDLWIFKFFNFKNEKSLKFTLELSKMLKIKTEHDLSDCIRDRYWQKRIISMYNGIFKKLNFTSLVLYHGPLNVDKDIVFNKAHNFSFEFLKIICKDTKVDYPPFYGGQVLTGDCNVKNKTDELSNHFNNEFKNLLVVMLPHHGSRHNWDSRLFNIAPNCKFYVSSYGLSSYGNPSYSAIREILLNSKEFIECNELKKIIIWYYKE